MNIVSKSPCRVDMAGGTLDIWPLYLYHDNPTTVHFAVSRYTTCELTPRADSQIVLRSRDLRAEEIFPSLTALLAARESEAVAARVAAAPFPARRRTGDDHALGSAGRRRYLRLFFADDYGRCGAEPLRRDEAPAREAPRDRAEYRGADHPRADRLARLLSGHVRRRRLHQDVARRDHARRGSARPRRFQLSGLSSPTPGCRATPASTTGKS